MSVLKLGIAATGRTPLKNYLSGASITRGEGIKAKCYDCMAGYADGKVDCGIEGCPLYSWMPYKGKS